LRRSRAAVQRNDADIRREVAASSQAERDEAVDAPAEQP
jgi:hypothetical protein